MKHIQTLAQKSVYWFKVIALGLILGIGIQFAQAWTSPTVPPLVGNVSGPLTTGINSQVKAGSLGVLGSVSVGQSIQIGTTVAACNQVIAGSLRYNTLSKCIELCDGLTWACLGLGSPGQQPPQMLSVLPKKKYCYVWDWSQSGGVSAAVRTDNDGLLDMIVHASQNSGAGTFDYQAGQRSWSFVSHKINGVVQSYTVDYYYYGSPHTVTFDENGCHNSEQIAWGPYVSANWVDVNN